MSQKGKVSATRLPGEQTRVSPVAEGRKRAQTSEIETISTGPGWTRQPRVLVVASYLAYGEGLAELLRVGDRLVELATNGIAALQLADHVQPDIVFCDLELRGKPDAHAVARALRADLFLQGVQLVALTVKDPAACEAEARQSGFDVVLGKSGNIEPLEELVRSRALQDR